MALFDLVWYCNAGDQATTGHYAVTKWAASATVAAGVLRRQLAAPTVGNERVFVCIVAGTTGGSEPSWVLTRGAKTTDNTVTWQECTGQAALNGDLTNTATWTQVKAATPAVLGQVIKRSNNASYQICTTAGAMSASEPTMSDTAGVTTTDTTAVWTSLGVVGNFTGGQAPFARLVAACAANWFAAGNTIYVGDNHAESQASVINISPAGGAVIGKIICHNHSGSYPPTASVTGATVSTTVNAAINITPAGSLFIYGLTFKGAVGSVAFGNTILSFGPTTFNQAWIYCDNCSFQSAATGGSPNIIQIGSTGAGFNILIFNNCTVSFANAANYLQINSAGFSWRNTGQILASGSAVPTVLIGPNANVMQEIVCEALDLSQITGTLFGYPTANVLGGNLLVKDCKLNASTTIAAPLHTGATVQLVRCDSGATGYKSARYAYEGTETTETSITRVGGAADPAGQLQSRKIVTTVNAQWLRPFKAEPYAIWNAVTGTNVTVTVCGTINAGALPNNDDIWLEVEYLGSSATPLGTIVTTTKSNLLAANAALSSDGSTWNGGGSGAGWSPFKLTTTLSSPQPGLAGYIHARVRAAKASTTYYIDPQIALS